MARERLRRVSAQAWLAMALLGVGVPSAPAQTPVTVDLLILYTPAVSASEGGTAATQARAAEQIAQVNEVFVRSETNTEIRLIGAVEVPYVESGSIFTDHGRINTPNDGYLDDVETLRNSHAADLVLFLIDTGDASGAVGVAGFPQPPSLKTRDTYIATVVGFKFRTIVHELGHLFGLDHIRTEREVTEPAGFGDLIRTPTYAAGHIGFGYGPLGVMFYTPLCNTIADDTVGQSASVLAFSNPLQTERGATLGDPVLADESRAIREAAPMIAAYSETSCQYAVSPSLPAGDTAVVAGSGQSFTYTVTTTPACLTGIRVPDTRWITADNAPALDARGTGTLSFTVQPNPTSMVRSAMVVMGQSRLRVNQEGSCAASEYVPHTSEVRIPAAPSDYVSTTLTFHVGVRHPEGCRVKPPTESASWLQLSNSLLAPVGNGRTDFIGTANVNLTPLERQTDVSFGDFSVRVVQDAGTCPLRLPGFLLLTSTGSNASHTFFFNPLLIGDTTGCVANASTSTPWLSFPGGSSVPFTQSLTVQAQANTTGATRTGSLTMNGREIIVHQLPTATTTCAYGVSFPQGLPAAGGNVSMAIATDPGCPWAVRSDSSFMSIGPAPVTGVGSAQVPVALAANHAPPRTAWYGARFSAGVEQAGTFTCQVAATTPGPVPAAGGSGVIDVTTACGWSVYLKNATLLNPSAPELTFTTPRLGVGNGRLEFSMSANEGYTRSIELAIYAGASNVTTTITQLGPLGPNPGCRASGTYTLDAPARTQSFRLRNFAPLGCRADTADRAHGTWLGTRPVSNAAQDLMVEVAANDTAAPRALTIAVNGATIHINQATAMTCKYVVPSLLDISGTTLARIPVRTLLGCPWSGSTTTPWLSGTPAGTGSGLADFPVSVDPFRQPRSGTVTIAGHVVTLVDHGGGLTPAGPSSVTEPVGTGSVVDLQPVTTSGRTTLSFFDVTTPGTVTITELAQSPDDIAPVPMGFSFLPGRVFDVDTTAAFDSLELCVRVTLAELAEAGVQSSPLRLLHRPAGSATWVDVTTLQDSTNGLLCGRVTSLSPFAIAGIAWPFTRFLSEGATSAFFDTRIALLNPRAQQNVATLTFSRSGAPPYLHSVALPPRRRVTVDPKALVGFGSAEFSTTITSPYPVVVDRTMSWNAAEGYGSHAETSIVTPSRTWYLAEGSTNGGFELFYLLQNPAPTPTTVRVRYLRGDGAPLEKAYTLPRKSRTNIWVNVEEFPGVGQALADADVSAVIESVDGTPIIVERAMYLSNQGRTFNAGHESAGVTAPALSWFLAEGATGPFFDLFVLIANPNDEDADVRVDYLLGDGRTYTKTVRAPANSRANIWVDHESFDGGTTFPLADVAVSTTLTATNGVPIIVERAMWWPGDFATWHEGHNSAGSVVTGTMWGLAEGEVGGARNTETYILVANVSPFAGNARVTLMFEDGTSLVREYPLAPNSRTNVAVGPDFGGAVFGRRFGAVVESTGSTPAQIVVERAMYGGPSGPQWSAGTNALATKLR